MLAADDPDVSVESDREEEVVEDNDGMPKGDDEEEKREEENEDEKQQPSSAPTGTDDSLTPAISSGEYNTAVASTQFNSVNGELVESGSLSSPASSPRDAPCIVSPKGKPILTAENTPETTEEDKTSAVEDENTPQPTVDEEILVGNSASEDTFAAGVQITSSMEASTTQDVFKPEIKVVELTSTPEVELALESEGILPEVEPVTDQRSKIIEPPSMDDKTLDELHRKNSIQDSNVEVREETQRANDDTLVIGLHNLSSQPSSSIEEPNQTGFIDSEQDAHNIDNGDQLMVDAQKGRIEFADNEEVRALQEPHCLSPLKLIEASTSSRDDPNAFAGLNALTVAIDSVNAQNELAQCQPKLDSSIDGSTKSVEREKTELEREMELFEAAEREEEARLLASMRCDQSMQVDSSGGSLKDMLNDRKRSSDSSPNEARKKRGKKVLASEDSKEEEDVCFICFDGGDLVLCDRRTCPKAYHLNCIGRDAAFFQKKGAWICGWHFCSVCTKPANFQCFTCPTAYCAICLSKADFLCVRQRKGLCEECWPIVKMIENKETVNAEGVEVDFNDQETYECLFKDYWEDLKQRLLLTPAELDKDNKASAGGSGAFLETVGSDAEEKEDGEDYNTESDNAADEGEDDEDDVDEDKTKKRRRGKAKPQIVEEKKLGAEAGSESDNEDVVEDLEEEDGEEDGEEEEGDEKLDVQPREFDGWASKELIEFVKFMNEDPKKPLSRFQVTKLLWSYIKRQRLQDPRKKTQILCDEKLRMIFGKKIVGQFEIYKHLQAHFAPKVGRRSGRQSRDDATSLEVDVIDPDGSGIDEKVSKAKDIKDKRRRRKVDEEKFERPNVDEFAAITPKNIGLIYLRRQLLEELLDDSEFDSKVCNTFVRIRVPGMVSKSEMCYRLVQIVGTRLQAEHYKAGRKTTNIVLEILNLQKREDVTVDLVSNHEFNEEECQRLRQSIKCGFIKTLTVGDIEDKARALQEAKVNDWFETERQRLVNLRDRASEKGRKKELRECVEKLQELNSPAFRAAKLHARPEVTADPRMDPNYESDGNDDKSASTVTDVITSISEKSSSPVAIGDKGVPVSILKSGHNGSGRLDWDSQRLKNTALVGTSRIKKGDKGYDPVRTGDKLSYGRAQQYGVENASDRVYDERDRGWEKEWVMEQSDAGGEAGWMGNGRGRATPIEKWNEKVDSSVNVDIRSARSDYRGPTGMSNPLFDMKADWTGKREQAPASCGQQAFAVPQKNPPVVQNVSSQAAGEAAEKEKIWHYMDPTGTVQGPFAMEQLRKWNTTGYFPEDLRIWKSSQPRDDSILLTDGLAGRFQKERESWGLPGNPVLASIQEGIAQALTTSSSLVYNSGHAAIKPGDGWLENGVAGSWAERGLGELGRSGSWGLDAGQSSRTLMTDVVSGLSAPFRETSSEIKWKPGPAAASWDLYGRSSYSTSPTRSGRAEAAARFDPANWGSRSVTGRPEREGWPSPTPVTESAGQSKSVGRNSWGRGSHRESGGTWNPDESGGHESSRSRGSRSSKKDIPCRFHQKGYCKRGDSCDFWHG